MRRLMLAAAGVLALANHAIAVDAPGLDQAAIKLFMYHKDCAPLSDSLWDDVRKMLGAMDEKERTRALMVVSESVAGHKDEFCEGMRPGVKKLEGSMR